MAFQKGQSGNPAGRKPKAVESAEQSVLLRVFDDKEEELVLRSIIKKARAGNVAAAKLLYERKYGRVPDAVESDKKITVEVEYI